jgi:hypothetical protein
MYSDYVAVAHYNQSEHHKETQDLLKATQEVAERIAHQVDDGRKLQLGVIDAIRRSHNSPGLHQNTRGGSPGNPVARFLTRADSDKFCSRILFGLRFPDMDNRYEAIPEAHAKTFRWIFEPPSPGQDWADVSQWLQGKDTPIYWITGKPGAGKSTLMR